MQGRKANPVRTADVVSLSPNDLERMDQAGTALATLNAEQAAATRALARELNYEGSTDPDVLENSARDAIRRIGSATFELGGYLLLLKSACAHGQFLPALERLSMSPRVAQQFMSVTKRFANTKSTSHLADLGVTKMVELMVLDDEQIVELTELGETGELHLDDVARMSVRELRQALRQARQDGKRQRAVAAEINQELVALKAAGRLSVTRDWPVAYDGLMQQADYAIRSMEKAVGLIDGVRAAAVGAESGIDEADDDSRSQVLNALADRLAEAYRRMHGALEGFAHRFNKDLGAFASGDPL